jgi:NAD kinase
MVRQSERNLNPSRKRAILDHSLAVRRSKIKIATAHWKHRKNKNLKFFKLPKESIMKFVVIGGDATGMSAASRAKRNRPDLDVTVLEKTMDVSYSA